MLPFLIVEHQFMKNSNRGLQYKIAMGYTSRALLYKMSVKLKKTEQRHCPPAPRATSPVSLVIFFVFFVVYRVVFFVGFIVVRN